MESAIEVHGLSKSYRHHSVLVGLNCQIESGAALGLLGANGSGKTTLLKILLGLIPADSGDIKILGENPRDLSVRARNKISYVPQTPNQFSWLSGRAMLKYLSAFYPSFDRDYADELSDRWKLSLRTPISVLSPGQQQRLSIVRALATRPELLILDEPIASLDPATRIAVVDELIRLRNQQSLTLLFSSHITADLERLCTDFAILAKGRIAALGPIAAFRQLIRTRFEGDETTIALLPFEGCRYVRKTKEGERMVLAEESETNRIRSKLPQSVRATVETSDLEMTFSEWMQ
jgi:ABC-2 type transport system ATP-binding protein